MPVLKEICVVQSKYTGSDGKEKTRWLKIGEQHENDNGPYLVLYPHINLAALPRKPGDDRLFASLFDPKPKDKTKPKQDDFPDDDLPPF